MKTRLDMDKIARGLGGERRGKVAASGGYFGAMQLLADIEARFRSPSGGGRPTDASWTERRLVPLAPRTLKRLEDIAASLAFEVCYFNLSEFMKGGALLSCMAMHLNRNSYSFALTT